MIRATKHVNRSPGDKFLRPTVLALGMAAFGVVLVAVGHTGTKLAAVCPGNEAGLGFSIGSALCLTPALLFGLSLWANRRGRSGIGIAVCIVATLSTFVIALDAVLLAANVGLSCSGAQFVPFLMLAALIFLADGLIGFVAVAANVAWKRTQ